MSYFLILMFACHILPVGLAIWGMTNRSPWIHVPSILVLMMDLGGIMLAPGVTSDGMFPAAAAWIVLGPVVLALLLAQAVTEAPLCMLPLFAMGLLAGVITWIWLWRRARLRAWTFAAVFAAAGAAWITAEVSAEAAMRISAQGVGPYCNYRRLPAPKMFTAGLSETGTGVPSHGALSSQTHQYIWSFRETRWVVREQCQGGQCWCYTGSHGLPNKPFS